jgi:hypothetical protein
MFDMPNAVRELCCSSAMSANIGRDQPLVASGGLSLIAATRIAPRHGRSASQQLPPSLGQRTLQLGVRPRAGSTMLRETEVNTSDSSLASEASGLKAVEQNIEDVLQRLQRQEGRLSNLRRSCENAAPLRQDPPPPAGSDISLAPMRPADRVVAVTEDAWRSPVRVPMVSGAELQYLLQFSLANPAMTDRLRAHAQRHVDAARSPSRPPAAAIPTATTTDTTQTVDVDDARRAAVPAPTVGDIGDVVRTQVRKALQHAEVPAHLRKELSEQAEVLRRIEARQREHQVEFTAALERQAQLYRSTAAAAATGGAESRAVVTTVPKRLAATVDLPMVNPDRPRAQAQGRQVNVGQTPSRVLPPAVTVSATTAMTQTAAESTGGAARAIAPSMDATAVQTKSTHDVAVNTAQLVSRLPNAITVSVTAMTQTVALTTASAARAQSPGRPLPAATSAPTPATTQPTGGATRVTTAAHAQRQGNATRSPGRRPAAVIASATATQTTTPARRVGGRTAGERVKARATTTTVASTAAPPMETTAAQTKPLEDVAANQPSSAAPAGHDDHSASPTRFSTQAHTAPQLRRRCLQTPRRS